MKRSSLILTVSSLFFAPSVFAAISLVAGTTGGPHLFLGNVGTGGSKWNTVPAGANANVYWDSDNNGVFGETAKGENSGNGAGTLGFTINITSGSSYYFAVEGFSSPGTNQAVEFDIHKTDTSIERLQIFDGTSETFFDSNGDEWSASYTFTLQGYGNVVDNVNHLGGGDGTLDHKGVVTFTAVPEPSSAALLGLGGLALIRRRRR